MKTQKTDKKQISVKNLIVCLNTYKNLSNFFINLSKTAKIYVKNLVISKIMFTFVPRKMRDACFW